jgi:hypothetical protein
MGTIGHWSENSGFAEPLTAGMANSKLPDSRRFTPHAPARSRTWIHRLGGQPGRGPEGPDL